MRYPLAALFLLLPLAACNPDGSTGKESLPTSADGSDEDGDGFSASQGDCDDSDAGVNPEVAELCDGADNDCDGETDEGVTTLFYADADEDGYGDSGAAMESCAPPDGYTTDTADCDDADAGVNPAAMEICDGIDQDCDGAVDNGVTVRGYEDADGDGYGDPLIYADGCALSPNTVIDDGDCDDSSDSVHPDATEICDGLDNDCDGLTDEEVSSTWYADLDSDSHGNPLLPIQSCAKPAGYSASSGDCDDGDGDVNPDAAEVCNGVDDDCDGLTDEDDALDAGTWYADADGDGWGDAGVTAPGCTAPPGYTALPGDCDDRDGATNLGATEYCDGADDDCDGQIDEDSAVDAPLWYADGDGDGFGDARVSVPACAQPGGYVADATDCDDGAAAAYPGAVEVCDGIDNDCDGTEDEPDAADALIWYQDSDRDSFGDATQPTAACAQPAGYSSNDLDCDDTDLSVYPGAAEYCNGYDDDCDGQIDEGSAVDAATWYADADSDGWGDPGSAQSYCSQPAGYIADDNDCDDGDTGTHPGAAEFCDGIDQDCDGSADEQAADAATWYLDADSDGWGNAGIWLSACTQPAGYVSDATDCDDLNAAISPADLELCNSVDDDCDGQTDEPDAIDATAWYQDADSDSYGNPAVAQDGCTQPAGYVADNTDCDDADPAIYPGADEDWYDSVDSDCDGLDDPDVCDETPPDISVAWDATCTYNYPTAGWATQVEWSSDSITYPTGSAYTRIMMQPVVGQLTDDNSDGAIDEFDVPDIAYNTFSSSNYSLNGYLRVVSGDGSGHHFSVSSVSYGGTTHTIHSSGGIAIGDLEGDGSPDIVTMAYSSNKVIALTNTGAVKWVSSSAASAYATPALADLDGDGDSEVLVGGLVLNSNGTTLHTDALCGTTQVAVADIDLDGDKEVVCGGAVYSHTGALVWSGATTGGYSAVGNFDADASAEILQSSGGTLRLYDTNGTLLWSYATGQSGGGPPAAGDIDGDGRMEAIGAFETRIYAIESNGTLKWSAVIQDSSSRSAGSALFDFNGDGAAEVVYADEYDMWVYNGSTGAVLLRETNHASGTLREYPVVADVDRDGNAEIVLASNNYARAGWDGLHILGETGDRWASAQSVYSQYAWTATAVDPDMSVPAAPVAPWSLGYGWHQNASWSEESDGAPDVAPIILGACEDCQADVLTVYVSIENTGAVFTPEDLPIALYAVNGAARTLISRTTVGEEVFPGERLAPMTFSVPFASVGADGLVVVVDDNGSGGTQNECDEGDNEDTWDEPICP